MSDELDQPKSYEERIAACPIHQWANIDDYLRRARVPVQLWRPFHELVLTRGEHPKYMNRDQGRLFGKRTVEIAQEYEMQPVEAHAMKMIFSKLIEQWLAIEAKNN